MNFKHIIAAALFAATGAHAASQLGEAPDAGVIVQAGGLEWVWAGPCAIESPSCGVAQLHHGFGIATEAQWLASFDSIATLYAAFHDASGDARCASSYFNTAYDHCDSDDVLDGYIWHSPLAEYPDLDISEGFLVRAPVPEPETCALMVLGLAAVGAAARRRRG